MKTVFSHIIRTRLSQESENVATEALAFVLESSTDSRQGLTKLLRSMIPDLPNLWFRTQQVDGATRPDMWGYDDEGAHHVFLENKFWAGLTDNQPVVYLKKLAKQSHPTLLLVVVPHSREQAVWRELNRSLSDARISATDMDAIPSITFSSSTDLGPILALTSWNNLLSFLENETSDDANARSDLVQLRALCAQANEDAFIPFTNEEMSDQHFPSKVLQLTSVVHRATMLAFDEAVLFKGKRLSLSADAKGVGYYVSVQEDERCGLWFGLNFELWKRHGVSPFWGIFAGRVGGPHRAWACLQSRKGVRRVMHTR